MATLKTASPLERLVDFVAGAERLFVLTGAGCSTESGIPDYRDGSGGWKRRQPMTLREFVGGESARRRYWARSFVGWRTVRDARPNAAHVALARLQATRAVRSLVTQNVDGLHQRAGSERVIDLHGRLDRVECLDCGGVLERETWQDELAAANPGWRELAAGVAPDGDADLEAAAHAGFRVPGCFGCGGVLKPAVVFFGEAVPRRRVLAALAELEAADRVLVAGSSLMVWSGYRFVRAAADRGVPVAAVNLGRMRADDLLTLKVAARVGAVLPALADAVAGRR